MAALEMTRREYEGNFATRPLLRVVDSFEPRSALNSGPLVANRRAARARMKMRRRRSAIVAIALTSVALLSWPGHAFGGTNGVGLPSDLASSSTWASGMIYVVEPGDTLASISQELNPVSPDMARRALIAELRSNVVVAGEHIEIP